MQTWTATAAAALLAIGLSSGIALGQAKAPCDQQGRVTTPQKIAGQVVKIDAAQSKISVRESDGTVHEFQASKETLDGLKVGDRIEANLREAPKCP